MPHGDRVLLGGVALEQDWGLVPDPEITAGILRRCGKAEPRLFGARVLGELNGLRPGREAVRVEIEHYEGATIVHNYGHGGCGVDRKSTRLNSSHVKSSYAVFCLKK